MTKIQIRNNPYCECETKSLGLLYGIILNVVEENIFLNIII